MKQIFVFIAVIIATFSVSAQYEMGNVVLFLRFADQDSTAWEHPRSFYETLFNDRSEGAVSVANYFHDASYGRMSWRSTIVPVDYHYTLRSRNYFMPKTTDNPEGYTTAETVEPMRMIAAVRTACREMSAKLPAGTLLDLNDDGVVDNLTVVVCGNSAISASYLLWPQNIDCNGYAIELGDKAVNRFLMVFDGANGYKSLVKQPINAGVVCHEMMHTLDARDLYSSGKLNPVGVWDLMSDNQTVPQGLTAYMRQRYGADFGGWIGEEEIETITEEGVYELQPVTAPRPEKVAYKIQPDPGQEEYFMIEYRDRTNIWDSSLPASGLIVYRVHPRRKGNMSASLFQLYVFRPGGNAQTAGTITKAAFGPDTGRLSFGADSDADYPFYDDAAYTRAPFQICDIERTATGMQFRYKPSTAGIEEIDGNEKGEHKRIYTLQGIPVERITSSGIYIIDGRKVSVRR